MGEKSEYSQNVPSDLEFLGGCFYKMPVSSLQKILESDGPGLRLERKGSVLTFAKGNGV
jgi:hypothetical protein